MWQDRRQGRGGAQGADRSDRGQPLEVQSHWQVGVPPGVGNSPNDVVGETFGHNVEVKRLAIARGQRVARCEDATADELQPPRSRELGRGAIPITLFESAGNPMRPLLASDHCPPGCGLALPAKGAVLP